MITRRGFLGAAGAFALTGARAAERPLWTAGIVSDTHVGKTRKSCELVRLACRIFAERKVDLFVNCGDIADHYTPEVYPILKEITDGAFTGKPARKLWVYANHDRIDREKEPWETVMVDVRRLLDATNDVYDASELKGYPLLVFPQWLDVARAERMLEDAAAKHPGKPIFVFDHIPPETIGFEGQAHGDSTRTELYSKFPQVIQVCGHAHGSLRNEAQIWQGGFTSVNAGCLFVWQGQAIGVAPPSKKNFGALVMEVFPDRVVFRRFDVRTGREYEPDHPWTVPVPFSPAAAPYARSRAAAREPIPQFGADASLTLKAEEPFASLTLAFPSAQGPHGTFINKVQVLAEGGRQLARCDFFGDFHLAEEERPSCQEIKLGAGYFEPGRSYRVRVTPCNCFGGAGRPIESAFVAPASFASGPRRFLSEDPMAECPFWANGGPGKKLTRGERLKAKDGWYEIGTGYYWMEFPVAIWEGRKGTSFRMTVDMETDQPAAKTWTIVVRNVKRVKNASNRLLTPHGKSGPMRYVVDFRKKEDDFPCCLLVREGQKGRIRFNRVALELTP